MGVALSWAIGTPTFTSGANDKGHGQGCIIHHWKEERFSFIISWLAVDTKSCIETTALDSKVIFNWRFHKQNKMYKWLVNILWRAGKELSIDTNINIVRARCHLRFCFSQSNWFLAVWPAIGNSDGSIEQAAHVINAETSTAWRSFHSTMILHTARV